MELQALCGAVERDMQAVMKYREYCRAQDAQLKSKMQHSAGKMPSPTQGAFHLLDFYLHMPRCKQSVHR